MSKKWDGRDRRKSARVPIAARVTLEEGGEQKFLFTSDVSAHGLFLVCDEPLELGETIYMQLSVPGLKPILPMKGKVVRRICNEKRSGNGVEFFDVTPEFQILLSEAIENFSG